MDVALPYSLAVTSGKGGVGKSCLALNLAVGLARHNERVLLVDADFGLGNQALLLGQYPRRTFEEVLTGGCPVEAAVLEGPDGVILLPAASDWAGPPWGELACTEEAALALGAFELDFDCIIVDTGAGIGAKVVEVAAAADAALLVTTPEATAVADAYALLKVLVAEGAPLPQLLVNMAESATEAEQLHVKFAQIARRFLGAQIDNQGYIPLDRYVREAVKRQMSFMQLQPPCTAAAAVDRLAARIAAWGQERRGEAAAPPESEQGPSGFFERLLARHMAFSSAARVQ